MTAKEWLNRARTIDDELDALNETRELMIAQLTKSTQTLTGDTVQSTKDPHKFDELGDLAYQIEQAVKSCHRIKTETLAVIQKVDNSALRRLLVLRYLNGKSWESIAVEMNYSWPQIHRLHGRALIAIGEVLKNDGRLR